MLEGTLVQSRSQSWANFRALSDRVWKILKDRDSTVPLDNLFQKAPKRFHTQNKLLSFQYGCLCKVKSERTDCASLDNFKYHPNIKLDILEMESKTFYQHTRDDERESRKM